VIYLPFHQDSVGLNIIGADTKWIGTEKTTCLVPVSPRPRRVLG
jgi:hypothetical protein